MEPVLIVFLLIQLSFSKNLNPKIGVVGSGVAGLNLVYELNKAYNWTNIHVYEKEDESSESAQTLYFGDISQDYGTVWLPVSSFDIVNIQNDGSYILDYDLHSFFKNFFKKYSMNTIPRFVQSIYHKTGQIYFKKNLNLVELLQNQGFPQHQILNESLRLLLCFEQIKLNKDILMSASDYFRHGFMMKGETLYHWGQREDMKSMAFLISWIKNIFGGAGPALYHTTYRTLNWFEKWGIPFIQTIMLELGIESRDDNRIHQYPFIQAIVADPKYNLSKTDYFPYYYSINGGFQSLWNNVTDELKQKHIIFRFSDPVLSISSGDDRRVKIITGKQSEEYDFVFVATRSDDALKIINPFDFERQYYLYKYGTMNKHIGLTIFNLREEVQKPIWFQEINTYTPLVYLIMDHDDIQSWGDLQSVGLYDCRIVPIVAFEGVFNLLMGCGYTDNTYYEKSELPNLCEKKHIEYFENEWGFIGINSSDVMISKVWSLVSSVTANAELKGWYQEVDALQGHDGLFFIGETLSGGTVPVTVDWIHRNFQHFHQIIVEEHEAQCA